MPKTRDYANPTNLDDALIKEGLSEIPHRVDPSTGTRVKPVFLLTIGNPDHDAIVTRLAAEGFAWEAAEAPAETDTGGGAGNQHGQAPGPTADPANIDGTKPEPEPARSIPEVMQDLAAAEATGIPNRRSVINIHVSDLFFNYSHDGYDSLITGETAVEGDDASGEELVAAIRADALEFVNSVLGAFGQAIDVDELVDDFFERL